MNGLPARPGPTDDELAAVTAAATLLLQTSHGEAAANTTPVWRFSGRWFAAGPFALRRPKPF
jgi:hypothetical protein